MAYDEMVRTITLEAGSDMSAIQYKGVDMASDVQIDVIGTKGEFCLGILQDKPAATGRAASVAIEGVTKVLAGAAVVAGTELIMDATGRVITTDAADQYIIGTALQTAAAAGDIIAMSINKYQRSA
jgi:hypothetical protein